MEFRHLKTFQTILETGSFLRAAEKLQYAQSTITLHIQQLETELGVKVFLRQGKKIEPTSAGRALESHANDLLQRAELLHQEMLELVGGKIGHLRIGSIEPVASTQLPQLLVKFCLQYTKVRLTLETGVTNVISQGVADGRLDLALCSPPDAKLGLNFTKLFHDSMALLIPEGHQLSRSATIEVRDLAQERLVLMEANCPYRQVFEQAILIQGVTPYTALEIMSFKALKAMVAAGLGIGVMPVDLLSPLPPKTVVKSINNLPLQLPVGIALLPEKTIPGLILDSLIAKLREGLKSQYVTDFDD
ncbi:MAG: LysR family transcriptional regulator [Cyanobacteria bacterium J06558_2]